MIVRGKFKRLKALEEQKLKEKWRQEERQKLIKIIQKVWDNTKFEGIKKQVKKQ